jgi:hypothetical protein
MHLPVHAGVLAGLSIDLLHNQPRRGVAAIDIPNLALLLVDATAHVPSHGEEVCQKSVAAPQVHEGLLRAAEARGGPESDQIGCNACVCVCVMCVSVCVCVCVCVCIYILIHTYVCVSLSLSVCMREMR